MENVCEKPLSSWPNLNTATSRTDSNWFQFVLIAVLTWVAATCFGNHLQGAPCPGRDLLPRLGTLCSGPLLRANRTKSKHLLRSSNLFLKVVSQLMTRLSSSSRFSGSWVCLTWWALCFSTVVKVKNTRQLAHLSISTKYLHLDWET